MEGRRRLTLLEQMSASSNGRALAGLSLDDVLSPASAPSPKQPPPAPAIPASISGRTLLDIIRDEEPKSYKALIGKKDKKPWKTFKDRLRLKKASTTWASSILVPASDVPVRRYSNHHHHQGYNHSRARCNSIRYVTPEPQPMAEPGNPNRPAPSFTRRSSVRLASPVDDVDSPRRRLDTAISEDRSLSAREAVAAQQAAEAEAAAAAAEGEGGEGNADTDTATGSAAAAEASTSPPVRMSLMDLLEETDRQMGLEGSRYTMGDEDEEEEEEEAAAEVEEEEAGEEGGGVEYSCCVCMVRHKGSAFIPCGHTFCRMCSRELWVQRGNCPLCNNYILEILDIF
ncbi:uncharacterized protein LOC126783712 [Argentina anserina]|uniref:uncharacterized protein LOC126783712 n=1 Tax=Argentina anserina TaxID=57926 RepID=UPI002176768A|nr:uncharacterized protein LOC126783712 [Potentilla anserina]